MNKDEIILMLQQLVASLQQQLADSNRKVDALLQEVAELKELLVQKTQEEQKQRNIARDCRRSCRTSLRSRHL